MFWLMEDLISHTAHAHPTTILPIWLGVFFNPWLKDIALDSYQAKKKTGKQGTPVAYFGHEGK